jgi:hypothetical protein
MATKKDASKGRGSRPKKRVPRIRAQATPDAGSSKGQKQTRKKGAAKKSAAATDVHPALMEMAVAGANCGQCVIETIENVCHTTVGSASDTLADLCSPCNTGILSSLESALHACNDRTVTLSCGMSVRDVIVAVCA